MFKNLTVMVFDAEPALLLADVEDAAQKNEFVECGPTQEFSEGWVPPREENGSMVESIDGHWIMKFAIEKRVISAASLKKRVKELADKIEQETGRKPGRKEIKALKEDARMDLLPTAQVRQSQTLVWIDKRTRRIAIDTTVAGRIDAITSALVEMLHGLALARLDTATSPQAAMSEWLKDEPPADFTIDRDCELRATDESKAVIRYKNHPLDLDEVQQHIEEGKLPATLALTHDDRVSFVLNDRLQIKRIRFLDVVFEKQKEEGDDAFDADVAIATGELRPMLDSLIDALGGTAQGGDDDEDDDDL